MKIEDFEMERLQSVWENRVKYNLTESGIHPMTLKELLPEEELLKLHDLRLGYGHTNGSPELRESISRLYTRAKPGNILVTNGSAEANFIVLCRLVEPGDEVAVMLPNYMQIWGLVRGLGAEAKPFYLKEELEWAPDTDELQRVVSSRTKVIAVCHPNNPTGAVMDEKTMDDIVHIARESSAWIFSDEVYRGAEMDGRECPSFWQRYDKTITTCGLSKAYSLPGLRVGWMAGPEDIIERCWAYHDYTTISSGLLSNAVASFVLQPGNRKKVLDRGRRILNENLTALKNWVKKWEDIFTFIPPRAGGIAYLKYNLDINSTELMTRLRDEKGVFVVPGDCFLMDGYIRIGIGEDKECFLTALDLFSEFLGEIKTMF